VATGAVARPDFDEVQGGGRADSGRQSGEAVGA
jgi:hypothetical protein